MRRGDGRPSRVGSRQLRSSVLSGWRSRQGMSDLSWHDRRLQRCFIFESAWLEPPCRQSQQVKKGHRPVQVMVNKERRPPRCANDSIASRSTIESTCARNSISTRAHRAVRSAAMSAAILPSSVACSSDTSGRKSGGRLASRTWRQLSSSSATDLYTPQQLVEYSGSNCS